MSALAKAERSEVRAGTAVAFAVSKPPAAATYSRGIVERVVEDGEVRVKGTNESVEASERDPVAVVRVYARRGEDYVRTDRQVAKPVSRLRVIDDVEKQKERRRTTADTLRDKVKDHNEQYGDDPGKATSLRTLEAVFDRGIGAYRTNPSSVRPNVASAEQWAYGRVNGFLYALRTGRFRRTPYDTDLLPKQHPKSSKKSAVKKKSFLLVKHYPGGADHDQSTHGNWAVGLDPGVGQRVRQFTQDWGGLSINMVDGSMPDSGYMVAKPPEFGEVVDAADFLDPTRGDKILEAYMRRHRADLGTGRNFLGTWLNEGKVYLDVSENVQRREQAERLGRQRNQKAIWDVANQREIDTGGTGEANKASGHDRTEEPRGHDRRGDSRLLEGSPRETDRGGQAARGERGLAKHYPGGQDHDQVRHGDWAQRNYVPSDAGLEAYREAFAKMTTDQRFAIFDYTSDGYKAINGLLRGTGPDEDYVPSPEELLDYATTEGSQVYEDLMSSKDEWLEDKGGSATLEESDDFESAWVEDNMEDVMEGWQDYAEFAGEIDTPREDVVMNIANLDRLIDSAPNLFGDRTLYRLYSNNVAQGLKAGDVLTDEGFTSTTYADLTSPKESRLRDSLSDMSETDDTVAVILPSKTGENKALEIELLYRANPEVMGLPRGSVTIEKEVLLPKGSQFRVVGTQVKDNQEILILERVNA